MEDSEAMSCSETELKRLVSAEYLRLKNLKKSNHAEQVRVNIIVII